MFVQCTYDGVRNCKQYDTKCGGKGKLEDLVKLGRVVWQSSANQGLCGNINQLLFSSMQIINRHKYVGFCVIMWPSISHLWIDEKTRTGKEWCFRNMDNQHPQLLSQFVTQFPVSIGKSSLKIKESLMWSIFFLDVNNCLPSNMPATVHWMSPYHWKIIWGMSGPVNTVLFMWILAWDCTKNVIIADLGNIW